jgi:membrane-bound serine protease (ClpP class)
MMIRMQKLRRRFRHALLMFVGVGLLLHMAATGLAQDAAAPEAGATAKAVEPAKKPKKAASLPAGPAAKDGGEGDKGDAAKVKVLEGTSQVAVLTVYENIMGGVEEYIVRSIDRAERENYGLLVILLDTPGGSLDDTQAIVKRMLAARVPIAVHVSPKGAHAGSAGTFITMAGHIASMAPGTRIGAAHPVMMALIPDMGGDDEKKSKEQKDKEARQAEIMNQKVTNDTAMFIVSIAKERGRNEEWAEQAVRQSVVATADEALEKKVVDLVVENVDELLAAVDGREVDIDRSTRVKLNTKAAKIEHWDMSLKQKVWTGLADPNLLMLLVLLGMAGVGMEFYHPGMIFPGVTGAICLLLAAISIKILPVSAGGLILILVGIGLMVAEAYVTSYGLLGIAGAGLMVLGGILLIDPSVQPHYLDQKMQVDWSVLIASAVTFGSLFFLIGYFVVKTQRGKIQTGKEGMVDEVGEAKSEVGPSGGKVFVHGEWWEAESVETIAKGAKVVVVEMIDGMKLKVEPKD